MKDIVGNEINIGDSVVIRNPGGSGLILGKIINIGKVRISVHHKTFPYDIYRRTRKQAFNKTVLTSSVSVYKISEIDLTAITLKDSLPKLEQLIDEGDLNVN